MEVTVSINCGRCGKKETKSLSLEAAQELLEKSETETTVRDELTAALNELLGDEHPDVVIATRTDDGVYDVKTLDALCDTPGAKRNKGCKSRVTTLIGDIFMTNEPAPSKKKPAKQQTEPTEPTEPTE